MKPPPKADPQLVADTLAGWRKYQGNVDDFSYALYATPSGELYWRKLDDTPVRSWLRDINRFLDNGSLYLVEYDGWKP